MQGKKLTIFVGIYTADRAAQMNIFCVVYSSYKVKML